MTNLRQNAKCHCFFPPAYIKIYLVVTDTRYTLLIYYTPEVYKHDVIKVSALLNRINKDWRFHSITAVSEKKRRRKVYILVAFGETFPTITCPPATTRWGRGGILRFYGLGMTDFEGGSRIQPLTLLKCISLNSFACFLSKLTKHHWKIFFLHQ